MNFLLEHPGLYDFVVCAAIWAVLCVGICLPLITLKLYWSALLGLFPKEPAHHEFDRPRPARPDPKAGVGGGQSGAGSAGTNGSY